ncbi:MAG: hypothetical protein EOM50_13425 [Erysipelotrichia bacterium]|nr:hypothetical protein [Erysipelotrichia bacterium]
MDNSTKVLDYFRSEIDAVSRKEVDSILIEVDGIVSEAVKEYQKAAKDDAQYAMQRKMSEANSMQAKKMAELSAEKNNRINEKRRYIEDMVFSQAKEALLAYTQSDQYLDALVKKIDTLSKKVDMANSTLYLKETDLKWKDKIADFIKADCKIEASANIVIGGFIVENKKAGIIIDESYDSLLEDQKEWFYANSGLVIR